MSSRLVDIEKNSEVAVKGAFHQHKQRKSTSEAIRFLHLST